jgi:hypothetical protein
MSRSSRNPITVSISLLKLKANMHFIVKQKEMVSFDYTNVLMKSTII